MSLDKVLYEADKLYEVVQHQGELQLQMDGVYYRRLSS